MTSTEGFPIDETQNAPETSMQPEISGAYEADKEKNPAEALFNVPLRAVWGWAPLSGRDQPPFLLKPDSREGHPGILVIDSMTRTEEFHSGFMKISFAGLSPSVEDRQRASQVTPIPVEETRSHRIEVALLVSPRPSQNAAERPPEPTVESTPEV